MSDIYGDYDSDDLEVCQILDRSKWRSSRAGCGLYVVFAEGHRNDLRKWPVQCPISSRSGSRRQGMGPGSAHRLTCVAAAVSRKRHGDCVLVDERASSPLPDPGSATSLASDRRGFRLYDVSLFRQCPHFGVLFR